jgi:hypothetical protein
MKTKRLYVRILAMASIVSVLMISSGTACAQMDSMAMKTPESRAAMLSDKMKTDLTLTDAQYAQVQGINLKYAQKNDSLFKSPGERSDKMQAMRSSMQAKGDELKAILTPDQFTKYQAMEKEMRQKMMQQRSQNNN